MSESLEVSRILPASPERIFNAWLSADEHAQMTGGQATINADGSFSAWDGYISGTTLERSPHSRIVQSWRTTEFPEGAPDSRLEIVLTEVDGGTRVTLRQTVIPDGQAKAYEQGWHDHYFDPMARYFTSAGSRIKEAGEALSRAAESAAEALEHAGDQAEKAMEEVGERATEVVGKMTKSAQKASSTVKKTAKKAGKKVKALVRRAKKELAKRTKKGKKPGKKVAKKSKKVAKKSKKAKKAGKKR